MLLLAAVAVALFLFVFNGSFAGPPSDLELLSSDTAQKTHDLTTSKATFKDPDPNSVIYTEKWGYAPVNQIAVVFEDNVGKDEAEKALEKIGGTIVGQIEIINLYQLETDYATEAELVAGIDAAFALDGVEYVFPNVQVFLSDTEGTPCSPLKDPVFGDPENAEHYNIIGMENAWKIIKGSGVELGEVNVGVLDEAIYTGSDEFGGKVSLTGDTTNDPAKNSKGDIVDGGFSHGTMVTHIIGADH